MQKICIVIPCYNEEKRLQVNAFSEYLKISTSVHFCFVNDGSGDNTMAVLSELQALFPEQILALDQQPNKGKAEAVRFGIVSALAWRDFAYVGFFDADLATPLSELDRFVDIAGKGYKVIIGSRIKRLGAAISRSNKRHYIGRSFATLASIVLKLGVYDTQCGAKLFESTLAKEIFNRPFYSRWIFDIEILLRAKALVKSDALLYELPLLTWNEIKGSKVPVSYFFRIPYELYKIKKSYAK